MEYSDSSEQWNPYESAAEKKKFNAGPENYLFE
jgi:hypothetical protein